MTYKIKDLKTQAYVSSEYTSLARAQHRANNLDLGYGAHRYVVVAVKAEWIDVTPAVYGPQEESKNEKR